MDHLTRLEGSDRRAHVIHPRRLATSSILVAHAARPLDEAPVLVEVTEVAPQVLPVALEHGPILLANAFERHDATVGQELRERSVQELVGLVRGVVPDQVDRHVVRGAER